MFSHKKHERLLLHISLACNPYALREVPRINRLENDPELLVERSEQFVEPCCLALKRLDASRQLGEEGGIVLVCGMQVVVDDGCR